MKTSISIGKEEEISLWKEASFPTGDVCSISILSLMAHDHYIEI